MVRTFKYRLYPTVAQVAALERHRAEAAQAEHDILYGTGTAQPMGVLHVRAPL